MSAVLFGSIGTLADTSELQRKAFNDAFAAHGLDWRWERDEYRALLERSGGKQRIADFAGAHGQDVDAEAVHATKSELFQQALAASPAGARDGVVETVAAAKRAGAKIALVTTTSEANIEALMASLAPGLGADDFDLIVDLTDVQKSKPDAAAYAFALERLGEDAADCVAIEDNVQGAEAARAAGVICVAFPGANNADHDFDGADGRVERLSFDELTSFIPNA